MHALMMIHPQDAPALLPDVLRTLCDVAAQQPAAMLPMLMRMVGGEVAAACRAHLHVATLLQAPPKEAVVSLQARRNMLHCAACQHPTPMRTLPAGDWHVAAHNTNVPTLLEMHGTRRHTPRTQAAMQVLHAWLAQLTQQGSALTDCAPATAAVHGVLGRLQDLVWLCSVREQCSEGEAQAGDDSPLHDAFQEAAGVCTAAVAWLAALPYDVLDPQALTWHSDLERVATEVLPWCCEAFTG